MPAKFLPRHAILHSLFIGLAVLLPSMSSAAEEVNLYTTREPKLMQPLLDAFTRQSGIKVNTVFVKDGLLERVKTEGERSPADLLITVDSGNLIDLTKAGVTQPIQSPVLNSTLAPHLQSPQGDWYALSLRDRVLYVAKDLPLESFHYEDLADPRWKGKVCMRSGQHPYNISLIAAMIEKNGTEATEQWLRGVKANLARKATGGDRDVARDIMGGICDIGLGNTYYVGHMKNAESGSDARKWGDAIKVIRPTFAASPENGTHVNISGAAVARYAPHRDNAVKLLEYMVTPEAQALYAQVNYEYPVRSGVRLDPVIESLGPLKADTLPFEKIAQQRKLASQLVDKVGFDY